MKRTITALAAAALAVPLLAACGQADGNDQVGASGQPESAPKAFGELDLTGATLQCATETASHVIPEYVEDAVGNATILGAAQDGIELVTGNKESAAKYLAATDMQVTAAAATGEQGESPGAVVNNVEVDATNADGHVVGVILAQPRAKGDLWLATSIFTCDNGSTK